MRSMIKQQATKETVKIVVGRDVLAGLDVWMYGKSLLSIDEIVFAVRKMCDMMMDRKEEMAKCLVSQE